MSLQINLETGSKNPIYKQLVDQFEDAIRSGALKPGEQVPSMNDFALQLGISKETVKKTYGILREKGLLIPQQGKGFYVAEASDASKPRVLVLFDKLSIYKEVLYNSLAEELGDKADLTILTHNQNLDLFTYYLDNALDRYDYYVISPHFPLDEKSQAAALKLISRVPNRKLIMVDHWLQSYTGNYGAVYQDFENDVYDGLKQGLDKLAGTSLKVITLPSSLYGPMICKGVDRFCLEFGIPVEYMTSAPDHINENETYLVINSQLDSGLAALARRIKEQNLEVGKDVFIISYNEFDLNEVVLNGLTTISTDFKQMGHTAAMMILNRKSWKVHCDFKMTRRGTF
ncbi:MAG: GntR family transcriptional regulator [Bacteroidales bacterium]|nr:GntR family transcriptional regulator [Bacteroidales bacterium]